MRITILTSSSRLRRWAVLGGATGLGLALLVFAPASWLAKWVMVASNEHVFLSEPKGTLWNGDAILVLSAGVSREANLLQAKALPGRIRWQLSPTWLGVRGVVNSDCCSVEPMEMTIKAQWNGAEGFVRIPALDWPLSILEGLGAPWNTIEPQGLMSLRTSGFKMRWSPKESQGMGSLMIEVQNFASRLSTIEPLGSYAVEMKSQDANWGDLGIALSTRSGALKLEGSGVVAGGRLRFDGKAYAAAGSETQLNSLLNVIGRREGDVSLLQLR